MKNIHFYKLLTEIRERKSIETLCIICYFIFYTGFKPLCFCH